MVAEVGEEMAVGHVPAVLVRVQAVIGYWVTEERVRNGPARAAGRIFHPRIGGIDPRVGERIVFEVEVVLPLDLATFGIKQRLGEKTWSLPSPLSDTVTRSALPHRFLWTRTHAESKSPSR